MGLLSRLLNMPSFNGATNALLIELAIPEFTEPQRSQLKSRVLELYKTHTTIDGSPGHPGATEPNATHFQLNIVARHERPRLSTAVQKRKIQKIKSVRPDHADEYALRAVARRLKWRFGVEIWIAEESISFDSW